MSDAIPAHILLQVHEEMADPELVYGGTGVFWEEFSFTERVGYDLSALKRNILYFISEWRRKYPDDPFDPAGHEREIALGLRDIARKQAGMPPLTQEERDSWVFEAPKLKIYWSQPGDTPRHLRDNSQLNDQETERVIAYLAERSPEVFRFIRLAFDYNKQFGFKGGPDDAKKVRAGWPACVISDAIANLFGETGERPLDASIGDVEREIFRRQEAK